MFAIARNAALGIFRRRRFFSSAPMDEVESPALLEMGSDVVEAVSTHQEFALAIEAIDALPARCREIVILRAVHGLLHKEIARQLGLSEQTVRVQVGRGMRKCADFLRERGVRGKGQHAHE